MLLRNHLIDVPRRKVLQSKLEDGVKKKMVFSVFGYYPAVRHKLASLGWIEKLDLKTRLDHQIRSNFSFIHLDSAPYKIKDESPETFNARVYEEKFLSDELTSKGVKVNLLFSLRRTYIQWNSLEADTIVSNFPKCNFCSKLGLNIALDQRALFNWRHGCLNYPRGYNMLDDNSFKKFTRNFRETSCFSLMRYIAHCSGTQQNIASVEGTLPWSTFYFAERVCKERLQSLQLENMEDLEITSAGSLMEETEEASHAWTEITQDIYNITSRRAFFAYINLDQIEEVYNKAQFIVNLLQELKELDIYDGMYNVWVLKPVSNCSGYGIQLYRQWEDIKKAVTPFLKQKYARFVIQKYIERPMLIHGVKFDLRVWFVVTNIQRLKIWVYHEGYVRFCSKPYSNCFLEDARHLTNVRIQRNNRAIRDPPRLPVELMWDFQKLREYFVQELGMVRRWNIIMKAMERSITIVMQSALVVNYIELRKNSFQLFGADFLIHENYEPCLIEVNNGPGLSPTTSIIAKKTTELLTDMVKVVMVDRDPHTTYHPQPDVGLFNLVYDADNTPDPELGKVRLEAAISNIIKTKPVDVQEWKKTVRMKRNASKKYRKVP